MIFAAFLLSSACAVDCLVAGLAYGSDKIKIPIVSGIIINLVSTAMLALSLFLGSFIGQYMPKSVTLAVACSILCCIGFYKIVKSIFKSAFKKVKDPGRELKISLFSLTFFIRICKSPVESDVDNNKVLSPKEAVILAFALSLDCIAAGLSAGLAFSGWLFLLIVIACSLIPDFLFLYAGRFIGGKIAQKSAVNLSWLSGLLLIGLAAMKIFL